jgi:hypothetical protein
MQPELDFPPILISSKKHKYYPLGKLITAFSRGILLSMSTIFREFFMLIMKSYDPGMNSLKLEVLYCTDLSARMDMT